MNVQYLTGNLQDLLRGVWDVLDLLTALPRKMISDHPSFCVAAGFTVQKNIAVIPSVARSLRDVKALPFQVVLHR